MKLKAPNKKIKTKKNTGIYFIFLRFIEYVTFSILLNLFLNFSQVGMMIDILDTSCYHFQTIVLNTYHDINDYMV